MPNVLFGYHNDAYLSRATIGLSGGSWLASMPLSNVLNPIMGIKAKSSDANASSTQFIMNMGGTANRNIFALCGTNQYDFVTGNWNWTAYRLTASANADGVTSPIYDSGTVSLIADFNMMNHLILPLPSNVSARYWKIALTCNIACEIGFLFLGKSWQPTINMDVGSWYKIDDESDIQRAYDGTLYSNQRTMRHTAFLKLSRLTPVELNNWHKMIRQSGNGGREPFLFYANLNQTFDQITHTSWPAVFDDISPIEVVVGGANGFASVSQKIREVV
jgi:hypothetical protein